MQYILNQTFKITKSLHIQQTDAWIEIIHLSRSIVTLSKQNFTKFSQQTETFSSCMVSAHVKKVHSLFECSFHIPDYGLTFANF